MRFFIGLHQPSSAKQINLPAFISVHRLRTRRSDFEVGDWIMDSGAFTTILKHGGYPYPVDEYAQQIARWFSCGRMLAAVSQDFMCEPAMIRRTGLSVPEHQRLTIERYEALLACNLPVYVMPVLQGFSSEEYLEHIEQYGERLQPDMWVGVGSVCKRNGSPDKIFSTLHAIKRKRPDLRLHGFGVKTTALMCPSVRSLLHSADSMAWSFAARWESRDRNGWREAVRYAEQIERTSHEQAQAARLQHALL